MGRLVGYDRFGWRVLTPDNKVVVTRDCIFDERGIVDRAGNVNGRVPSSRAAGANAHQDSNVVADADECAPAPACEPPARTARALPRRADDAECADGGVRPVWVGDSDDEEEDEVERYPPALERGDDDKLSAGAHSGVKNGGDVKRAATTSREAGATIPQGSTAAADGGAPATAHAHAHTQPHTRTLRPSRGVPPPRFGVDDYVAHMASSQPVPQEPASWREAAASEVWSAAMKKEVESLQERGTWEVVHHPRDEQQVIPSKWVYKAKLRGDGSFDKAKARLVACGNFQMGEGAYSSPAARASTVRVVFAIAAARNEQVTQYDVASAYLYGDLTTPVLRRAPPGIPELNGKFLLLRKAIYGLREAGAVWYELLSSKLTAAGLTRSAHDPAFSSATMPS